MSVSEGRWLDNADEISDLAEFNGRAIAAAGHSGYLHPGDIFHRSFGGNRHFAPERCIRVWEDAAGVAAWVMLQPKHEMFDLQVRPDLRDVAWEAELAEWSHGALGVLLTEIGSDAKAAIAETFRDDPIRTEALASSGWVLGEDTFFLTARTTADPMPIELPEGYTIRSVSGIEEASSVDALHSASFGSTWAPGEYAKYMSNPGYFPERELLAVSPEGDFAAFTVMWHDEISGTGLFEPVGTHPEHRKLGLGRAILAAGLEYMADAGLHTATVMFEAGNPAARGLYLGSGFEIAHELPDYVKPFPPEIGTTW